MTLMERSLHQYHEASPARDKWTWAQTALFMLATCGLFWAGVIALALSLF